MKKQAKNISLKSNKSSKSSNKQINKNKEDKKTTAKKSEKVKGVKKKKTIKRSHHKINLEGQVFGRVASQIALIISGKRKINYSPNQDLGDYVSAYNLKKIKFKGDNKLITKKYYHYSGYPGGIKERSLQDLKSQDFAKLFRNTVFKMLPKDKLKKNRINRLKIYYNQISNNLNSNNER
ncbi:MAG: 50S ribosomal protein L13 [Candidatus Moranbacteria bacterium]|nr:50S ribosomal protein L13 [Candidatus Moranbacteria bacterium]